jgi:cytochrome c553
VKRLFLWGMVAPWLLRRLAPPWFLESPLLVAARHPWVTLGLTTAVLAAGGLAVAASGLMPLRASAGHWGATEWLLHFAMQRSIATYSLRIEVPPLDDPALVLRGAGHYDQGCSPCHGGVGGETPRIPMAMLPPPPYLPPRIPEWRPRELFYIVKHGVKFTGMPAWPAQQRDDEVWAVVAFLQRLPRLGVEEYQRLARGEATALRELPDATPDASASPPVIVENCARCHGLDGLGRGIGAFPRLAGQRADYMDRALRAYADGRRHSGTMGPIAASLSAGTRQQAVRYYASLPPFTSGDNQSSAARGEEIAVNGLPAQMVPACTECHGPSTTPKNPAYPNLAGQHPAYLSQQLQLLRNRRRGGSEYVHLMHSFVDRLTDDHIADVAAYFASLESPP